MYDVCIIGGGQSGLVTCKTFVESGKNVIVLEKCDGCIGMFSTIKEKKLFKWSTSRYMSGFSDFPIPKSVPVWFTIEDYLNYLKSYVSHFNLDKYIKYNSNVKKCYQNDEKDWIVEYNNEKLICKKLIICSGLNQTPEFPEIVDNFTGEIIHTEFIYRNMYKKDWENKFTGKRILLLGGAESAYDIGHILVKYCNQLYYSSKNYTEWFPKGNEEPELVDKIRKINKKCLYNAYGITETENILKNPTDTQLNYIEYSLPEPMSYIWQEHGRFIMLNATAMDCAKCTHQHAVLCKINETPDNLFNKNVVKRTEFLIDIHDDKVNIVFYPYKIYQQTVYTKEQIINNVDIIVCATGFKKYFPFLDDDVWKGEMIKKMVPVKYSNIAFVGFARPTMGSIASIAEMQSWWLEKYFYDKSFSYKIRKPWFKPMDPLDLKNGHINTLVIGCYYLKDIAKDVNIEPNMFYLLFTDFELFLRIYTGSCHPIMYRIHGCKKFNNSRQILLDTYVHTNEKNFYEWRYICLHLAYHLVFIVFLIFISFILSYFVYLSKKIKKLIKYKQLIFIIISIILILGVYTFF